jgi:DNA replication protein DnaC
VDKDSAELGLPGHREHVIDLDRDHRQICKLTNDKVFERIVRHITRLVVLAERSATDERPEDRMQAIEERHSEDNLAIPVATSAPLLSTINFSDPKGFIGHQALQQQLVKWLSSESSSLILYGQSGSGFVHSTQR